MTWVDPESRDTGDLITAAIWNQDVVDNTQWLKDNLPGGTSAWVYNSSNILLGNGGETMLTFDTEWWDTDDIHSTLSNTGRLTAPVDGLYLVGGACLTTMYDALRLSIRLNGTAVAMTRSGEGGFVTSCAITTVVNMQAGDYVTLHGYQNESGGLYVDADGYWSPSFWMVRIGEYVS